MKETEVNLELAVEHALNKEEYERMTSAREEFEAKSSEVVES